MTTPDDIASHRLCVQFPLRKDYIAQVVIPTTDMTKREAERLGEFVKTLAIPDSQSVESRSATL